MVVLDRDGTNRMRSNETGWNNAELKIRDRKEKT